MDKKTGTIITAVVGVLTLLCCTSPACIAGILIFTGTTEWTTELGSYGGTGYVPPGYGTIPCCLSILVLIVPVLLWVFLVRGKEDSVESV